MKTFLLPFYLVLLVSAAAGQPPAIVKPVGGTTLEPYNNAQEAWQNNQWNGLIFYQGKGTPTKLSVTDGTTAGTQFLSNIGSGIVHKILPAKDFVYVITIQTVSFSPFTSRYEIWKSDGTTAGTSLVYTLPDAVGISNGDQFCSDPASVFNYSMDGSSNNIYFSAYDAVNGNELWVSDGTAAGTHLIKDIKAGAGGSFPWGFFKIGSEVFFNCTEVGLERKLWKTDGTAAGTQQIPVAEPFFIVNGSIGKLGSKMIFFAHNTADGYEPYVSDGTAAGTFMLANINAGSANSLLPYVEEANLKANSTYCFLVLQNGTDTSLYRTDGTSAGTIRIAPAGMSVYTRISTGAYSDVDEDGIWIMKYDNAGSGIAEKIYRSNGTLAGTYLVAENISYGQKVKIYKNALWMQARNTGSVANVEPWRSGGNAATTNKAFEIDPGIAPSPTFTPYSSNPYGFFVKNGRLYFFATPVVPSSHNLYQYTGDFTFNGSLAGGNWKDSANWNGLMPPGITDSVFVNAGTPNTINISGVTAYAGTLLLGNNAAVNVAASTDSLVVNTRIAPSANNGFTGNGVLALKNAVADTVEINSGFTAANLALQTNAAVASGTISINNNLNLINNSQLVLNNSNIVLTGSSASVSQTGNSYITTNGNGKLTIENMGAGGRTGAVNFPVGTSSGYTPALITNAGTADNFSVRVQPGVYASYSGESGTGSYSTDAVNATWFISESVTGGTNADITLQWNASQELPGFDRSISRFGHYTGSWQLSAASPAAGSNPYTFSGTGITSFSPFGILNSAGVLPLQLIQFTAEKCGNREACLNWITENEINVSHFVIERSTDGQVFTPAATVAARNGLSNSYNYTDDIALLHYSNKIYYRIKQVDADGKFKVTHTVFVTGSNDVFITVYPNPVAASLYIHGWKNALHLQVFDMAGNKVQEIKPSPYINTAAFARGVYLLKVTVKDGRTTTIKFTKQ